MAINLAIVSKFDDGGIKKASHEISGLGKTLAKVGGVLAAAFSVRAISDFARESVLAAEGVATANSRIAQIAESMSIFGDQTQAVTDRLIAYAKANEFNLATDAEVIKATQAKLLTFKELAETADEAGGSFDRATLAAIDLAAAGFGTAETNAIQLGKALNDPIKGITALTRSGVTFTEAEQEKIKAMVESGRVLEAQNMILSAIETQVGGTAAATANASDKMKIAFDNVKETVGAALLPAFEEMSKTLLPIIQEQGPKLAVVFANLIPLVTGLVNFIVNGFIPALEGTFGWIGENIATVGTFTGVLGGLLVAFNAAAIATKALAVAQGVLNAIMAINPLTLVAIAVAALAAGIVYLATQTTFFQDTWKAVTTFVSEQWEAFGALFGRVGKAIGDFFTTIVTNISDSWKQTVQDVSDLLNTLSRFFSNAFTTIRDNIVNAVSDFGTLLFNAGKDLIQGLINGVLNIGQKIKDTIVNVVDGAVQGVKELLGIRSPSRVFTDIGQNIGEGMVRGIDSKIGDVAASAKSLAQAAVPAGYEWVMGPNGPYLESKAVTSGRSDRPVSSYGATSASFLLRQQGFNQSEIDQVLETAVGGTLTEINASLRRGITLVNSQANLLAHGNFTEADISDYVARGFEVVEKIARPVVDVQKSVADLVGKIQAGDTAYLKPMATGGIVTGPTPALIGEAGPEAVIPLSRLGDMGGTTYNITVNAGIGTDGGDVGRQIVEAIKRYERRSGKVFAAV